MIKNEYLYLKIFEIIFMPHNRLLLIRFENIIVLDEFEPFRRATVNELKDKDILFHNHLPDGMEFRHPSLFTV